MPARPHCQQSLATRDGHDPHDCHTLRLHTLRAKFHASVHVSLLGLPLASRRDPDGRALVLRHPLSATSVMELLADRGIDVSNRTVLRWVQSFGP